MNSFYEPKELLEIGFKTFGENVLISRKTSIYGAGKIEIGSNVRIDDFCILSGKIKIGNYVHIAPYCGLFSGDAGIVLSDFSGLSSRCSVYAVSDDYSGEFLSNPTVPFEYRDIVAGEVFIGKHVVVGSGSTILPCVRLEDGCSFGAMSLINKSTEEWGVYVGIPCKRLKERKKNLLTYERMILENNI